jgi:hypothetical protein
MLKDHPELGRDTTLTEPVKAAKAALQASAAAPAAKR